MRRGMRYDEIRDMMRGHFATALASHKAKALEGGRLSQFLAHTFEADELRANVGKPGAEQTALDWLILDDILDKAGLSGELAADLKARLLAEYRSADRSYGQAVLAFDKSLGRYELEEVAAAAPKANHRSDSASVTVADLALAFAQYNLKQGIWNAITKAERLRHIELLTEVIGDAVKAADVTVDDAIHVRNMLLDMPSNRNKKRATK